MKNRGEIKVKSLQKAMEVLECFIERQPLGVTEISAELGLYKSNVHNILMTFTALGYLEQDPDSGKYRLGVSVVTLSRAFRENFGITKTIAPFMREIANEAGEVVYLSVPRGDEVIYLDAVFPENQKLSASSVAGDHAKLYCTSVGKAFLSCMPENVVEELIPEELEPFTEYTITERDKLLEEIKKTKKRGYGLDNMELMFGIKCVGIALVNHKGEIEAGLSISAPSLRMDDEKVEKFVEILHRYRHEIQKML